MISKLTTTPIPIQQNFDVAFSSVRRRAACRRHRRSFLFPLFVLTSHINCTLCIKEYRAWLVKSNQYRRQLRPIPPSLPVCYRLCDNSQACCAATVFLNSLSVSALALVRPHRLCSPPSPSSVDTSALSCQTPQQHRRQHTGIHASPCFHLRVLKHLGSRPLPHPLTLLGNSRTQTQTPFLPYSSECGLSDETM